MSFKLWRPFEDKIEEESQKPMNVERIDGQTKVIYTFDLNRQRSQPIGYITTSPPKQVISSQASIYHMSGNRVSIPILQSTAQVNWSKVKQRYMGVQPKPGHEESRSTDTEKHRFQCNVDGCSKTFVYKSALESHRLVHSSERRFRCSLCDKRYKQLSGLYSHQSVKHTDRSQRFVCNDCHYTFVDYRNLRMHEFNQHLQTGANQSTHHTSVNHDHLEREM